jgi:hypothetical protein
LSKGPRKKERHLFLFYSQNSVITERNQEKKSKAQRRNARKKRSTWLEEEGNNIRKKLKLVETGEYDVKNMDKELVAYESQIQIFKEEMFALSIPSTNLPRLEALEEVLSKIKGLVATKKIPTRP